MVTSMITKQEFLELYKKLQENYKGMESLTKMIRSYEFVSDLPKKAVEEIINFAIDNERYPPLPSYFEKASKDWKNRFYRENGYYYGTEVIDRSNEPVENISDEFLEKYLSNNKVKSILDLVLKNKQQGE